MCQVTGYRSRTCGHRWLTVTRPCIPGTGFTTHPQHEFKSPTALFGGPKYQDAAANTCPNCDLKGQYDGNKTRMVLASGMRECGQRTRLYGRMPVYGNGVEIHPPHHALTRTSAFNRYGAGHSYGLGSPGYSAGFGGAYGGRSGFGAPINYGYGYGPDGGQAPSGCILL